MVDTFSIHMSSNKTGLTGRLPYARRAIEHGWSHHVLNIHIERRLLESEGQAISNFVQRLPSPRISSSERNAYARRAKNGRSFTPLT